MYFIDIVVLWIVICLGEIVNTFAYIDIDISDINLQKCQHCFIMCLSWLQH